MTCYPGERFLISDSRATFLASFLGVVITLVSTRLWVLYSAFLLWGTKRFLRRPAPLSETIPLIGISSHAGTSHTQRSVVAEEIQQLNDRSHSDIGLSIRLFANVFKLSKNFGSRREELVLKLGLALCFFTLFALATIGGIFSAEVVLNSVAICKSPHCGYWGAIQGLGPNSDTTTLKISKAKQNAAAAQAATCYRESFNGKCNNLLSDRISYTKDPNATCPLSGDVCLIDAFRMDTGHQNIVTLGVSSKQRFLFKRTTTCAPVSVNETYANLSNDSTGSPSWKYKYGDSSNATFEIPLRTLDPHNAAYVVE
jgi:hypothetical protein